MSAHLYDPLDPTYLDPQSVRAERDRTFQICSDCRVCVKLCPSFKDLFRMIDGIEGATENVGVLSDHQHSQIIDECYQCKLCYVICPYVPERKQEWKVDFPRLMLRSLAVESRNGTVSRSAKLLARTDLQGTIATSSHGIVNALNRSSIVRGVMQRTVGIAKDRLLPSFATMRFSKWFRTRELAPEPSVTPERGTVALFPTCLVEYQEPAIGKALVGVYERNRFRCELPDDEVCCGMPWLDAGDVSRFEQCARHNVARLVPEVRAGKAIIVAQPTCGYVFKQEYPDFLGSEDARLVAAHTFDAAEYLMARHRQEPLDTNFTGRTYTSITWQAACHYRAQQMGPKSKDLMALTGAKVQIVERCSAIDGTWGYRAENIKLTHQVAQPLMTKLRESDAELIAGDCHLANTAILEDTGKAPLHPLQVLARAYGLAEE